MLATFLKSRQCNVATKWQKTNEIKIYGDSHSFSKEAYWPFQACSIVMIIGLCYIFLGRSEYVTIY